MDEVLRYSARPHESSTSCIDTLTNDPTGHYLIDQLSRHGVHFERYVHDIGAIF